MRGGYRRIPSLFTLTTLLALSSLASDTTGENRVPLRQWVVQSACKIQATGEIISTAGFKTADWHSVEVPSTVLAALVADHSVPDPFFGKNIVNLPGYSNRYDFSNAEMPESSPYKCAWWYRTEFATPSEL